MSATNKTNIILWSSLAASTAGIVALAAALHYQRRNEAAPASRSVASRLRDVQDVLTDCYDKINEIESRLPSVLSDRLPRSTSASIANAPQN